LEAAEYAYKKERCVCVLPTGTGKTLIGLLWASRLLEEGKASKVLVLEPTRYLVEQVTRYYRRVGGLEVSGIHGGISREKREHGWRAKIVVATPEVVLSDLDANSIAGFDAVIIDECHHTTGQDAYAKLARLLRARYRLGLSAYIPRSRVREIERYIGKIRRWSLRDPRIRRYVPSWIGEIYEAPLNEEEEEVLHFLEEKYRIVDRRHKGVVRLAIRFFVRDGVLALKESLERRGRMWSLIDGVLEEKLISLRPAHKLPSLRRILEDHEGFSKAIVFIDRVSLAYLVSEKLEEWGYRNVVLCGRSRREKSVKELLSEAYSEEVKVVVSTSAGEEGIDLPSADLLVIWSNIVSTLRFIQRHGRLLRKHGDKVKFVAYIVTPGTLDVDSLVDGLFMAKRAGVDVPIEEEVLRELVRKSFKARILELLEDRPLPSEWIAEILGISENEVRRHLSFLAKSGEVVYFYTHLNRVYVSKDSFNMVMDDYAEWFRPRVRESVCDVIIEMGGRKRRLSGRLEEVVNGFRRLVKEAPVERVTVSVQVFNPDLKVFHLVNVVYSFQIDSEELAEYVLRNAFRFAEFRVLGS